MAISDWPIINRRLEAKIEERWGSGEKVVPGQITLGLTAHDALSDCIMTQRLISNLLLKGYKLEGS